MIDFLREVCVEVELEEEDSSAFSLRMASWISGIPICRERERAVGDRKVREGEDTPQESSNSPLFVMLRGKSRVPPASVPQTQTTPNCLHETPSPVQVDSDGDGVAGCH